MNRWSRGALTRILALACLAPGSPGLQAQEPSVPVQEAQAVPLSLSEVLKSALEKNLDIAVGRYDPKIQETAITSAESAFDPFVNGSAQVGEDNSPQADPLSGAFVQSSRNKTFAASYVDPLRIGSEFQLDVFTNRHMIGGARPTYFSQALATYTQPFLRNFGRTVNMTPITVAQNNREISRWKFRQTVMDTLAQAEAGYYDLKLALMNMETAQAYLKLAQDFLGQTRIRVKVGTLPPIEITQAEAGVADREEAVILSRSAIQAAEDNLRRLMNIPSDSPLWKQPLQPTEELQVLEKLVDVDEAIRTAMEKRPDLEQARLDLSSRDADLRYRENQKLYRLDLVAKYGASGLAGDFAGTGVGDTFDQIGRRELSTWSAELQLGIPLGNRAADSAYAAARYTEERAKLTVAQLEQVAQVQVRTAARDIDTNLKRYRAALVNTRLQKEKLDAEQKKYENGMSTTYQVLQFQTDLSNARARENQAIVDYNKSLVELDRVLGILLDTRNVTVSD